MAPGHRERRAVEHPAAVPRIEGIGIPSAALVDQATYMRTVRTGLSGQVVKQAIDAIGHRDFFVRLLGTTSGHLSRLYGRKSLGAARIEGLLDRLLLFAAAADAFGGLERAQDWLGTAPPAPGGDRPSIFATCSRDAVWYGRSFVRSSTANSPDAAVPHPPCAPPGGSSRTGSQLPRRCTVERTRISDRLFRQVLRTAVHPRVGGGAIRLIRCKA